jgi:DNA-binding Xre family transcriptional regulator
MEICGDSSRIGTNPDRFGQVGTGGQLKLWQTKLRQLREQRGLTQESVAWRAGMSVSGYRKLETGLRGNVRLSTLERIAWVLACDVKDLL